eukprot:COSAG02_NODE_23101_length_730_cov_1.045959_1_plen_24_part_01
MRMLGSNPSKAEVALTVAVLLATA